METNISDIIDRVADAYRMTGIRILSEGDQHAVANDVIQIDLPEDKTERELLIWWLTTAYEDFKKTVPKQQEYGGHGEGSADLEVMGDGLAAFGNTSPEILHQELACWFYALGKISRLISDYKNGKPGKADTWFDLTVYSLMARRLQAVGCWP